MSESPARSTRPSGGSGGGDGVVTVGTVVTAGTAGTVVTVGTVVGGGETAFVSATRSRISGTSQSATSLAVSWLKWTPSGRRRTSSGWRSMKSANSMTIVDGSSAAAAATMSRHAWDRPGSYLA